MINTFDLDYKHLKRTRRVNGERVIEFTVFPTNENKQYFDLIVEEAIVTFKDDEYVIKKLEEKSIGETYFKQVTAIHKFYVDLINKQQPRIHNGSITFREYMNLVFEDTPYQSFTIEDSFAARQFENLGNDNRLALLQKGLDRFKAEMAILPISYKPIFKIEVGEETDFQFRYGHNIKSISKNIDTTNLATKISGTGDPELNIKASYTSPNVAIFGEIDAPPVNDERFKSNETLLAEMKARLIDEPEVSITLDFVDLRAAGYPHTEPREGNKVWLIYEPMDDLLIETRILEIVEVYDSNEKVLRTEVTLANHKGSFAGTMFENTQKQLSNLEAEQNRKIQQVIESADGKNSNYYGANEPVPPKGGFKKGDLWFKVVDGEYTQTWRFDGDNWVIIVDIDSKEIREEAEEAKQRAEDAYDRAGDAINDAQVAFDKAQAAMGAAGDNANDIVTIKTDQGAIYTRIESAEQQLSEIDGDDRNILTHNPDNWEVGGFDTLTGEPTTYPFLWNCLRSKDYYNLYDFGEYTFTIYEYDGTTGPIHYEAELFFYDLFAQLIGSQKVTSYYPGKATFTIPFGANMFKVQVKVTYPEGEADPLDIGSKIKLKLRKGDKATQWTANPGDMGEVVNHVVSYVSEFRQTASTLSNRIESSEGDISSVTQLATGLQTRVENAEGDISSVTQLANTIQSRVGNIENGTASIITQLNNNINARVVKGDVINQINISDEDILISGKKLILDGDTTVNGSFKVTDANITSLDAGKITTGTLDAANVSIINLNVNRLVGNYATFVNDGFNSIGSQVKVSSTGLSTYSGGLRTSLLNGSGHRFYRDGYSIGNIGTNKYVGTSLRGLDFNLEYEAHNMTWGAKLSPDDNYYSVLLAWERDSSMGIKGFSFSDVVTFNEDVTFRDDVTFNFGFKLRTNGYAKSYTDAVEWGVRGSNYNITQYDSGQIQFYMGSSTPRHTFFPNGTKSGGSIEIGNEILGMSPVDSPQILIEYIEFDIDLSKDGTIVYLDEEYLEAVSNYAVFLNKGEVIEKAEDYFVVVGEGLADARIVGKRTEYEEAFWGDMKSLEKPQKENEPQMRMMSVQDDKIEGFWKRQKKRRVVSEKINGKTMKKVYREELPNED